MKRIQIGIYADSLNSYLHETLSALRENTEREYSILLLLDGPQSSIPASADGVPQFVTPAPLGAAACFNRLLASAESDVTVFLEAGTIVAPDWLRFLLKALSADDDNGLAGPSTNRSWNEQAINGTCGASLNELARAASQVDKQFAGKCRILKPLYSLGDFCYAVRRETFLAIGGADERYGMGPCWEMDYNIRAARAGIAGVWAQSSFVYRREPTQWRRQNEARWFEHNKRLYQDKFCGRQLRKASSHYRNHCRGDACPNFAPARLIECKRDDGSAIPSFQRTPPAVASTSVPGQSASDRPLVSCIMPTADRAVFVLQSIRYLERQTYSPFELIILDDGCDDLANQLPTRPWIRYHRVKSGTSIGAKRNEACKLAHGEIIAHWDDDDWYNSDRLERQVMPLIEGSDLTGLRDCTFFDLGNWQFWSTGTRLHQRLFMEDVHGGTLVYKRRVWEEYARFPDCSLAEDGHFLTRAVKRGARLYRLPADQSYLYVRHARSAWDVRCGQYLDPGGWSKTDPPNFLSDEPFYRSLNHLNGSTKPKVSCIMPTADRLRYIGKAVEYFRRQTYPNLELVIVDDGFQDVRSELGKDTDTFIYLRLNAGSSLGAKRNLACEAATGEIIVHWDDDDWMASWRVDYQVRELLKSKADVCGLGTMLYLDSNKHQAFRYVYPATDKMHWVAGNSLCYLKRFWQTNQFPEINVGEDSRFVRQSAATKITTLSDDGFMVGLIHGHNVSPKNTATSNWHPAPISEVQDVLLDDWRFYEDLGELQRAEFSVSQVESPL